jgi:CRP/FNR family transcriptional regulator
MLAETRHSAGPAIHAVHPWAAGNPGSGLRHQLLSDAERTRLAKIASIVRVKKGEEIYREGEEAEAAFNIFSGVVSAYQSSADGDHISSFLYPGDLFGLSEEGRYTNSTRATTPVVAYKMPLAAVRRILDNNADLDVNVIIKLCEELRQAQRHAFILAQRRAATRLAMFLDLQEHLQLSRDEVAADIYLPMDRSSIADYLGLTLAAVGRAFRALTSRKIISLRDRHHVQVLDRTALDRLADWRPVEGGRKG